MSIELINDKLLEDEKRFHSCLADVPGVDASDMKEFFDYIPRRVIIPKLNEVINGKADVGASYTKSETDARMASKADVGASYTKSETDARMASKADADSERLLCEVTSADDGKFLRVVDGKWRAVTVASAEGEGF